MMKDIDENIAPISSDIIVSKIFMIRGRKVMMDSDLADLYAVSTKRLNEQVKRNTKRFPADFMFQLNKDEKDQLVANCDHLSNLKYSRFLPYAFTEHGTIMLASILNSDIAINASISIVRAFVQMRDLINTHQELSLRIDSLESHYDEQFKIVFDTIRELMKPIKESKNPIGFQVSRKEDNE